MKELSACPDLEVEVVAFSKRILRPVALTIGVPPIHVHILPALIGTGMPSGWILRRAIVKRYLRTLAPDIVHGHRTITGYGLLAVQSGYPSLITIHEIISDVVRTQGPTFALRMGKAVESLWLKRAPNVIAVSQCLKRKLSAFCSGQIHTIPNMVDSRYYSVERGVPGARILTVGRICPEKGNLDLIRAAAILGKQGSQIALDIVGGPSGPSGKAYLEECRVVAAQNIGTLTVEFHGALDLPDIAALQAKASVAVFPSTAPYETFCLGVAEALAASVPSIVYRHGPLPEHIEEGINGFIVEPGDIDQLAASMGAVVLNPVLSRSMGISARNSVARYRPEAVIAKTVEVYRSILSGVSEPASKS
jgi:glycosyltransferase involved in cell wall biosynthesis